MPHVPRFFGPVLVREIALCGVAAIIELTVWSGSGDRTTRWGTELPAWIIPLSVLLVFATLPFRWRRPTPVFVLQIGFAILAEAVVPQYQPFMGVLIALHALARLLRTVPAVVALGASLAVFALGAVNTALMVASDPLKAALLQQLVWTAVVLAIWGWGHLALLSERRAEQRRVSTAAESSAAAVRSAQAQLARELHDTVSNAVSAMLLQAAGARAVLGTPAGADVESAKRALETIQGLGLSAMTELRRLLSVMLAGDGAAEISPGWADVNGLIELARTAGVQTRLHVGGEPPPSLPRHLELVIYRVLQEALTNVMKHAGPTTVVDIEVIWTERDCLVRIRNKLNEPLTVPLGPPGGFGLRGLRERVSEVGGTLMSGPVRGQFQVEAHLPLTATREAALR